MTSQAVQFAGLVDIDRKSDTPVSEFAQGDRIELRVHKRDGCDQTLVLSPPAMVVVETLVAHLLRGARVAVLVDEQELSPAEVAAVLDTSPALAIHRMEIGELPFRYVGEHRRVLLRDVLELKAKLDVQRQAIRDLCAEDLQYGT